MAKDKTTLFVSEDEVLREATADEVKVLEQTRADSAAIDAANKPA